MISLDFQNNDVKRVSTILINVKKENAKNKTHTDFTS